MLQKLSQKFDVNLTYFISGGKWLIIAQIFTLLFSVIATIVVANVLSPHDFGVYKYLVEVGLLLSFFSMTGLANAILQATSRRYNLLLATRKLFLISCLPITAIALALSAYYFFNENIVLAVGCLFVAALQPFIQIFNNNQAFLNGDKNFKTSATQRVYKSALQCVLLILAAFFWSNGVFIFIVFLLTQAIFVFFNTRILRYYKLKHAQPLEPNRKSKYLHFAKHTSVRNLISGSSQKVDSLFLFQHLGSFELATFAIALIIPEQLRGGVKNLQTLLIPKFSQKANTDLIEIKFFKHTFSLFIGLAIVSLITISLTPLIIEILLPKYNHAAEYAQILLLMLPAMISVLPISLLQSLQANRELYIFHTSVAILQTIGSILSIIIYGLIGAIVFRVAIHYFRAVVAILLFLIFRRRIQIAD